MYVWKTILLEGKQRRGLDDAPCARPQDRANLHGKPTGEESKSIPANQQHVCSLTCEEVEVFTINDRPNTSIRHTTILVLGTMIRLRMRPTCGVHGQRLGRRSPG